MSNHPVVGGAYRHWYVSQKLSSSSRHAKGHQPRGSQEVPNLNLHVLCRKLTKLIELQ